MAQPRGKHEGSTRFHTDRVVGGDRDHRGPDRLAPAGGSSGKRSGKTSTVRQQSEADRSCRYELRKQQRLPPPGGESTNFNSPPLNCVPACTQFVDSNYSMQVRVLQFLEGTTIFNSVNFNYEYNFATSKGNVTAFCTQVNTYICPSSVRQPNGKDGAAGTDSDSTLAASFGGYGVGDYGATVYTDISPIGATSGTGSTTITPYRDKNFRANGLLKQGKTTIAEATDGTSNTIMVAEDAGRDPRYISPYTRGGTQAPVNAAYGVIAPADNGLPLRFWRWSEADNAFGVSGQINNPGQPQNCGTPWQATCAAGGNNAGNNDEIFAFHPGGANAVFGDGSVKFLKASINIVVLRNLVTLNGGEVVSADQY